MYLLDNNGKISLFWSVFQVHRILEKLRKSFEKNKTTIQNVNIFIITYLLINFIQRADR